MFRPYMASIPRLCFGPIWPPYLVWERSNVAPFNGLFHVPVIILHSVRQGSSIPVLRMKRGVVVKPRKGQIAITKRSNSNPRTGDRRSHYRVYLFRLISEVPRPFRTGAIPFVTQLNTLLKQTLENPLFSFLDKTVPTMISRSRRFL